MGSSPSGGRVVIDDEKLQELLTKASSLYHNGEYKDAIVAWRAALTVDSSSQKAQEGIRMATLLLADWEPTAEGGGEEAAQTPADGADAGLRDLSPEEMEAHVDLGLARIRQLLSEQKYAEALEGARGLAPQHPDSEEVQKLLEEVQQAYESAPFVDEHFTLARELVQQERFAEAEAQCQKVLALDASHREASELLAQIRSKIGTNLERAAEQIGGMTVKLNADELKDLVPRSAKPSEPAPQPSPVETPPETSPAAPPAAVDPSPPGDLKAADAPLPDVEGVAPAGVRGEDPVELTGDSSLTDGDAAASQEQVAARAVLDAAFAEAQPEANPDPMASIDQDPAPAATGPAAPALPTAATNEPDPAAGGTAESSIPLAVDDEMPDLDALGISVEDAFAEPSDSSTVPPAASAEPAAPAAVADPEAPVPAAADGEPAQPESPIVVEAKTIRPPTDRLVPSEPLPDIKAPDPAPSVEPAAASPEQPPAPGEPVSGGEESVEDAAAWEKDLTQLNQKVGEREIMEGTGASAGDARADDVDDDLLALLDNDLGPPGDAPAGMADGGIPLATMDEGETTKVEGSNAPMPAVPAPAKPADRDGMISDLLTEQSPQREAKPHKGKAKISRSAPFGEPSRVPRYFALFGLLLLVGGAVVWWHFFFRPQSVSSAGAPSQPGPPPSDPLRDAAALGADPIPTPIGGGGQPATKDAQAGGALTGVETQGIGEAGSAAPVEEAPPDGELTPEQIKPEPPLLSPAEKRRKVAVFRSKGERWLRRENWRAARAAFQAALALDPVNFEIKDLADRVQVRMDEEQKLQESFESARKLFDQGEYQDCLWKLYRLPRQKGLGDIDLYIRNAWYNWAVTSLKAGDTGGAIEKVSEVLQIDPSDQDALKIEEVAEKYRSRRKDRIYYAFAQRLDLRKIDGR